MAMFGAINDLFGATIVRAKDIRILVVNCGVLNATPSLSSTGLPPFCNLAPMACQICTPADLNDLILTQCGAQSIDYKPYFPDYKLALEHACIFANSKKVLDKIQT
ncbi:unnamed protein product [Malus baccata var. baccata]